MAVRPDLERLLEHSDPEIRGEAALVLAHTGQAILYPKLRALTEDTSQATRLRAIVALGHLAAPGCETVLGKLLRDGDLTSGERSAAALGLGLLPESQPAPAIDEFLRRATDGSYRRHRHTLGALLLGLFAEPHPSRTPALIAILQDRGNRESDLRRLILDRLTAQGSLTTDEITPWLTSRDATVRAAAVNALRRLDRDPESWVATIEPIAERDRSPIVRAAALDALVAARKISALDHARRALRSSDPYELASGVRAIRHLGGGATRLAVERQILASSRPEQQAAMLRAYRGSGSRDFVNGCLRIAADHRRNETVRTQAACAAAESGDPRARSALRLLFMNAEDPDNLIAIATQLRTIDPEAIALDRVFPARTSTDLQLLPGRLIALVASRQLGGAALLQQALRSDQVDDATLRRILRLLRRSLAPRFAPDDLAMLPKPLSALYE